MPNKTGKKILKGTLTCDTGDPQEGMERRSSDGQEDKSSKDSSKHITKITKEVGEILEL